MREKNKENLTLEDYENEFSYQLDKSNLNISFNRIAFIFFIFLMICFIFSIKVVKINKNKIDKRRIIFFIFFQINFQFLISN